MSNSFDNNEIQNYQFLIDAHIQMIGGKKKADKEYANLKKIEQNIKETMGTLEKKNFPQKVKALKVLFKIQLSQKTKIYKQVKRVLFLVLVSVSNFLTVLSNDFINFSTLLPYLWILLLVAPPLKTSSSSSES